MKKIILILVILFLVSIQNINIVFASVTILPSSTLVESVDELTCYKLLQGLEEGGTDMESIIAKGEYSSDYIIGCAIKSGYIKFWMVPYIIRNIMQWLISIAGLISLLMTIVGAYYYIYGSLTDDKDKGKTIIKYALGGLILTTLAWVIVNVILLAITS